MSAPAQCAHICNKRLFGKSIGQELCGGKYNKHFPDNSRAMVEEAEVEASQAYGGQSGGGQGGCQESRGCDQGQPA